MGEKTGKEIADVVPWENWGNLAAGNTGILWTNLASFLSEIMSQKRIKENRAFSQGPRERIDVKFVSCLQSRYPNFTQAVQAVRGSSMSGLAEEPRGPQIMKTPLLNPGALKHCLSISSAHVQYHNTLICFQAYVSVFKNFRTVVDL